MVRMLDRPHLSCLFRQDRDHICRYVQRQEFAGLLRTQEVVFLAKWLNTSLKP